MFLIEDSIFIEREEAETMLAVLNRISAVEKELPDIKKLRLSIETILKRLDRRAMLGQVAAKPADRSFPWRQGF